MGYRFTYLVTRRGGALPVEAVVQACRAAGAAARLRRAVIGMAGYRDMRLYGTLYDGISLKSSIGPEIEHFDLLELQQGMAATDPAEVAALAAETQARWRFLKPPQPGTLEHSVRLFLALRRKIAERGYDALSFTDVDGIKRLMGFAPAGALTLLHDHLALPTIPENDSLGAVTQLMVHFLTGQIAAYLEFYEFTETGALLGVPDYVPAEIVEGPVTVLPNAFGGFGEGLLSLEAPDRVRDARPPGRRRRPLPAAPHDGRGPHTRALGGGRLGAARAAAPEPRGGLRRRHRRLSAEGSRPALHPGPRRPPRRARGALREPRDRRGVSPVRGPAERSGRAAQAGRSATGGAAGAGSGDCRAGSAARAAGAP